MTKRQERGDNSDWKEHLKQVFDPFLFGERELVFKADGLRANSVEKAQFEKKVDSFQGAVYTVRLVTSKNVCENVPSTKSSTFKKSKQDVCKTSMQDKEKEILALEFSEESAGITGPWIAYLDKLNVATGITGKELQYLTGVSASDVIRFALKFSFEHVHVEKVKLLDDSSTRCRDENGFIDFSNARWLNIALGKPRVSYYQKFDANESLGFYPENDSGHQIWNEKWNHESQKNFEKLFNNIFMNSGQTNIIADPTVKLEKIPISGKISF